MNKPRFVCTGLLFVSMVVGFAYFAGQWGTVFGETEAADPADEQNANATPFLQAGYVLPMSGRLTDGDGKPLPVGSYKILASLYSSADEAATPDCSSDVEVKVGENGEFGVHLILDDFDGFDATKIDGRLLYVGIRVVQRAGGETLVGSPEMYPRICIWPVLFAKNSGLLAGHSWEEVDARFRALEARTKFMSVPDPNAAPAEKP